MVCRYARQEASRRGSSPNTSRHHTRQSGQVKCVASRQKQFCTYCALPHCRRGPACENTCSARMADTRRSAAPAHSPYSALDGLGLKPLSATCWQHSSGAGTSLGKHLARHSDLAPAVPSLQALQQQCTFAGTLQRCVLLHHACLLASVPCALHVQCHA